MKYDYFVGGRWRNHEAIRHVLDVLDSSGKSTYCFINNSYDGDDISIDATNSKGDDVETFMQHLETIEDWQTNPTYRQIFENDMNGIKDARETIIVFPAGLSAHMELGAAYGMGKKCYGIGKPEKYETLYLMFDEIYPDIESFMKVRLKEVDEEKS